MSAERETITVAELIEELRKMPQNLEVWAEGCDCTGEATGCEVLSGHGDDGKKQVVLICR